MNTQTFRKHLRRGQGLVEYALIILLVAIIVIVVITYAGFAAKRNFGIVAGALGASHDETTGSTHIEITTAQCLASTSQNLMGIWVLGRTNVDPSLLTGSTDLGYMTAASSDPTGFRYNPLIGSGTNLSQCPKSVVIQAVDGTTSVAPVTAGIVP